MKNYYALFRLIIVIFVQLVITINPTDAQITPSDEWVNFHSSTTLWQGAPVPVGVIIDAYDPDGSHCGSCTVTTAGEYGFLIVYRDDALTSDIDEGAEPGDTITFKINGKFAHALGTDPAVWTENGSILEVDLSDNIPPQIKNSVNNIVMHEDDPELTIADLDTIFIDPDDDPLKFSSQSDSHVVRSSIDLENRLIISVSPDWFGETNIVITAQDQWFSMNDTVLVQVLAINDPPVIYDLPDTSFSSDVTFSLDLNKYVDDIDHQISSLSWTAHVQPPYDDSLQVEINHADNVATFSANHIFSASTEIIFAVTDDSLGSDQDTMAVQVNLPVNVKNFSNHPFPETYSLSQNYPNPFNSATMIHYQLPRCSHVTIKVLNSVGQEVAILIDEPKNAGYYSIQWDAVNQASGLYLFWISAGEFSQYRKILLLR